MLEQDNPVNELMECRVCSLPISADQGVSLFLPMNTKDADKVVKTIVDVIREFAHVEVSLSDDRSKHICSTCLTALESGVQLQQQIRANEIATIAVNAVESNMRQDEETAYEFEYLDEFKDEITSASGCFTEPKKIEMAQDEMNVPEDDETPGNQLVLVTEEDMEFLHEDLLQEGKFAFQIPPDDLIAQQLIFDNFKYLEIRGERCCGCPHIAPTRHELMMHAREKHSQNYYADSSYTCPTCYEKFATEESLAKHTQYYSYSDIFLCSLCQTAFTSRSHIMHHLKQGHNYEDEHEYEFELPNRKSPRKLVILRVELPDSKIIKETVEYPQYRQYLVEGERCCACGLIMESIEAHVAKEHPPEDSGDSLQCTICARKFPSLRLLKLHEQEREKLTNLYECRKCGKLFDKKHSLLLHLKEELEPPLNQNDDTCIPTDTKAAASSQQALAVPLPKEIECFCCCIRRCREEFTTEDELLNHARLKHDGRRKENEIKRGKAGHISTEHMCPICLLSFETEEKVQKHRFYKMRVERERCHLCGRKFMRKSGLREHQEREHLDLPPQFECETCGKRFIARSTLTQHKRVHGPFKSFPCSVEGCNMVFRDEHLMRRHFRNVHAEGMPYVCHCQKTFRTKESYDIHMRSHTGERPFACRHEGCPRRFAHGTDRMRHERSVHTGERPHKCTECSVGYFRKRELRIHIAKVH